jgi:hypothetical protein
LKPQKKFWDVKRLYTTGNVIYLNQDLGPYAHVCASVCIDQLEQHRAGRQNDGSWNYPTLFDLADQEAINEYNKMWDQVANWP